MDEKDYIDLNTLLAKLRVICLKSISELDCSINNENIRIIRKERERNVNLVRNIDNIRKQIPLKIDENITIVE